MPIPLTKHAKIWVNPKGIIPEKIRKRLRLQRRLRPYDELTLFVNKACLEGSAETLEQLNADGISIKIIEDELDKSEQLGKDKPELIQIVRAFLKSALDPDNPHPVKSSVMVSDYFRITNCLQDEGIYSDTDLIFLDGEIPRILDSPYLLGAHDEKVSDFHLFGMDESKRDGFQEGIIQAFTEFACPVDEINPKTFMPLMSVASLYEDQDHDFIRMNHLDFPQTGLRQNVVSGKDDSHAGGEALLHQKDEDPFLTQVRHQFHALHDELSQNKAETNDAFCKRMKL